MATKKKTTKPKGAAKTKPENGSVETTQAWERGASVKCAKDESAKEKK